MTLGLLDVIIVNNGLLYRAEEAHMAKYIREIRVLDLFLYFVLPLIGFFLIAVLFGLSLAFFSGAFFWIALASLLTLLYFDLKYLLIGSVLLYKAVAPMSLRNRCRFEPSCSTYMIAAVQKYGLIRGFIKGIRRIMRCHPPNGGVDLP